MEALAVSFIDEFSFASFILPEIGTIVSGMLFLGFSEVIRLLQDIKDKL